MACALRHPRIPRLLIVPIVGRPPLRPRLGIHLRLLRHPSQDVVNRSPVEPMQDGRTDLEIVRVTGCECCELAALVHTSEEKSIGHLDAKLRSSAGHASSILS